MPQSMKNSRMRVFARTQKMLVGNNKYNPIPTVSGGTLTSDATYYYMAFTSSGTLTITGASITADILIVGGGGGGGTSGANYCGGGGAGGLIQVASSVITGNTYTITVGAGGATNSNGANSVFGANIAYGGGYGAYAGYGLAGGNGGSGGGGTAVSGSGGTAVSGQGNIGGYGSSANAGGTDSGAGGGGGAGGAGNNLTNSAFTNEPANGGVGLQLNYTGALAYYAEGGKGSGFYDRGGSANGIGGAISGSGHADGTVNTGSGGGGGRGGAGGAGGSGIIIFRYTRAQVGG
jgi:hypothetical protein